MKAVFHSSPSQIRMRLYAQRKSNFENILASLICSMAAGTKGRGKGNITFTFTFNHLADAFIQSDVQMRRTIEAIRPSREQQYTSALTSLS